MRTTACRYCSKTIATADALYVNALPYCNSECRVGFINRRKDRRPKPEPPKPAPRLAVSDDPRTWSLWDWERYVIARARGKEEAYAKALKEYTTI